MAVPMYQDMMHEKVGTEIGIKSRDELIQIMGHAGSKKKMLSNHEVHCISGKGAVKLVFSEQLVLS